MKLFGKMPWRQQPQVVTRLDLSNPIARKVRYCSTLGPNVVDIKTGKLGTINGGAPRVATPKGMARGFTAASSQSVNLPTTNLVSGYPLTVACWTNTTPSASGAVLFSLNGTNYTAIAGYLDTSRALLCSGAQDPLFNRQVLVPAGLIYLVAIYRSNTWDVYADGVLLAQSNLVGSAWGSPAAGNHSIGSRLGGASLRYNDGTISDFTVFEGELSVVEVKSLSANPDQIYLPSGKNLWVAPPSGAPTTHATTGALAPSGAEVVGAAARAGGGPATHDGTGALATTGATIAGTAARFRAFATTGVLSAAGAEVVGAATRFRAFATSGVLTNAGATIAGTAARFRTFGTSGALATAGATITGVSLRYRAMGSSGALVTAGATVAGTAARFRAHGTSGALATGGASITGSALRLTPGGGVYPDPADVRAGVIYGPTGAEFTGTMSILLDLNTGRLVKIIGQKVALLL